MHTRNKLPASFALLLTLVLSCTTWAQNYNAGMEKARKQDYVGAFNEWSPLANQGDAKAQFGIGRLYEMGKITAERGNNTTEAAKWFLKAAEQGYAPAQTALGVILAVDKGDEEGAFKWFLKAAEQGDYDGISGVIESYEDGSGVEVNDAEALKWYRELVKQHSERLLHEDELDSVMEAIQELEEKLKNR